MKYLESLPSYHLVHLLGICVKFRPLKKSLYVNLLRLFPAKTKEVPITSRFAKKFIGYPQISFAPCYQREKISLSDNYNIGRCRSRGRILDDELLSSFLQEKIISFTKFTSAFTPYIFDDDVDTLKKESTQPGFEYNVQLINQSAENGSIQCFRFLLINHCPIQESTFLSSIKGGNTEIIQLLLEHLNGQVPKDSLNQSIRYHQYSVTNWLLVTHDFEFNYTSYPVAIKSENLRILLYLKELNFRPPEYVPFSPKPRFYQRCSQYLTSVLSSHYLFIPVLFGTSELAIISADPYLVSLFSDESLVTYLHQHIANQNNLSGLMIFEEMHPSFDYSNITIGYKILSPDVFRYLYERNCKIDSINADLFFYLCRESSINILDPKILQKIVENHNNVQFSSLIKRELYSNEKAKREIFDQLMSLQSFKNNFAWLKIWKIYYRFLNQKQLCRALTCSVICDCYQFAKTLLELGANPLTELKYHKKKYSTYTYYFKSFKKCKPNYQLLKLLSQYVKPTPQTLMCLFKCNSLYSDQMFSLLFDSTFDIHSLFSQFIYFIRNQVNHIYNPQKAKILNYLCQNGAKCSDEDFKLLSRQNDTAKYFAK